MNLFTWLFIGHLVGDFLLQTNWMATRKSTSYAALFVHVIVYTLCVFASGLLAGGLSMKAVAVIFLTHFFIDRRKFTEFWVRAINGADGVQWLKVVSDQCWHLLILALVTLI